MKNNKLPLIVMGISLALALVMFLSVVLPGIIRVNRASRENEARIESFAEARETAPSYEDFRAMYESECARIREKYGSTSEPTSEPEN